MKAPLSMKIGSELYGGDMESQRRAQMIALSRTYGAPLPDFATGPQKVASKAVPAKIGAADCDPLGGCEQPEDPRVLRSIAAMSQGAMPDVPDGMDPKVAKYIWTTILSQKYCPSPKRVGWQQSSMTFKSASTNDATDSAVITVTPSNGFCMNSLVAAAGTSSDINYEVKSFAYAGTEYVTNGPWWAAFYTAMAACCLCVKQLPVIEPNTSVTSILTNRNGAAAVMRFQIFGKELFCG